MEVRLLEELDLLAVDPPLDAMHGHVGAFGDLLHQLHLAWCCSEQELRHLEWGPVDLRSKLSTIRPWHARLRLTIIEVERWW